ncbi:urease accessory protein UreD [Ancylobacter lacus]|uniref:urease accessory protein UreD n=1 Tax=Ancylobacter lacus TaxID=2579970 RepID=UPI001BCD5BD9|nr:urease accessory protein UreD [Ancylobacter lacus]MBS7540794.1 urease accessory protein UreD [Ancylobacter lacus]
MNAHLPPPRRPELDIAVERRDAASRLVARYVAYPFHLTRPFALDPARPEVATLYIQSSSGGFYAGEDLTLRVRVGRGAALHLTTQASTIVHGDRGQPARMRLLLEVEPGGFLAYTPDPQILFPGAACETRLEIRLQGDAEALLTEGLLLHDPARRTGGQEEARASGAPMAYSARTDIHRDGCLVFSDRQRIAGPDLARADGPLHGHRVAASALWLGQVSSATLQSWEDAATATGSLAGASLLPGGCGAGLRLLATDGAMHQRAQEAVFAHVFTERFGIAPTRRRK